MERNIYMYTREREMYVCIQYKKSYIHMHNIHTSYIHIHIHTYMHMYIYIYIRIYIYIYVYNIYTYTCIRGREIYICTCVPLQFLSFLVHFKNALYAEIKKSVTQSQDISPIFSQKNLVSIPKSLVSTQKSPISTQKSPIFTQKSPTSTQNSRLPTHQKISKHNRKTSCSMHTTQHTGFI